MRYRSSYLESLLLFFCVNSALISAASAQSPDTLPGREVVRIQPSELVRERYVVAMEDEATGRLQFYRCLDTDYDYRADFCRRVSSLTFSREELLNRIRFLRFHLGMDTALALGTLTVAHWIFPGVDPRPPYCEQRILGALLALETKVVFHADIGCVGGDDELEVVLRRALSRKGSF